ncbi:MAG: lipid-A-disaccharide synthase [Methylothermaceae bacteria B42]|nr:MAG: lipid-A-disaccharide synthase [Methylothermaceae bacteria B42]
MPEKNYRVMLSAGEASGDRHGALFYLTLKRQLKGVSGFGMGGEEMQAAGVELLIDANGLSVIGVTDVFKRYRQIRKALRKMQAEILSRRPDLLICIDYKEFNLRLARFAKRAGVKVLFYVGPQVWAWRPGRLKDYAQAVDHMAVIFPFELPYYEKVKLPATYVGHPLVQQVQPSWTREKVCQFFELDPGRPIIALLPGSREDEVKRLLPVMAHAWELLSASDPKVQGLISLAPSISDALISQVWSKPLSLKIIRQHAYEVLQYCDAAVVCSGTATLELALLQVPMVIVYRLSPLTYRIGKWLVKTPYIGLPNILADREICREFIQDQVSPTKIEEELKRILANPEYANSQRSQLAGVKKQLGNQRAAENLARLAANLLHQGGQLE